MPPRITALWVCPESEEPCLVPYDSQTVDAHFVLQSRQIAIVETHLLQGNAGEEGPCRLTDDELKIVESRTQAGGALLLHCPSKKPQSALPLHAQLSRIHTCGREPSIELCARFFPPWSNRKLLVLAPWGKSFPFWYHVNDLAKRQRVVMKMAHHSGGGGIECPPPTGRVSVMPHSTNTNTDFSMRAARA